MAEREFSVAIFFLDGTNHFECRFVSAQEAMEMLRDVVLRPAAKMGIITRAIITDGGDYTNAEWEFGKGFTYPPEMVNVTLRAPQGHAFKGYR